MVLEVAVAVDAAFADGREVEKERSRELEVDRDIEIADRGGEAVEEVLGDEGRAIRHSTVGLAADVMVVVTVERYYKEGRRVVVERQQERSEARDGEVRPTKTDRSSLDVSRLKVEGEERIAVADSELAVG